MVKQRFGHIWENYVRYEVLLKVFMLNISILLKIKYKK